MFGIGGWEFVLIVILALLLFGPDKLPQFARTVGRFMREFKRYQDLMEATIRAEMFNADPSLRKDAFEAAKEARKRTGAGGGFTEAEPPAEEATPSGEEAEEPSGETPETSETPEDCETSETPKAEDDGDADEHKDGNADAGEGEQGDA